MYYRGAGQTAARVAVRALAAAPQSHRLIYIYIYIHIQIRAELSSRRYDATWQVSAS